MQKKRHLHTRHCFHTGKRYVQNSATLHAGLHHAENIHILSYGLTVTFFHFEQQTSLKPEKEYNNKQYNKGECLCLKNKVL